MARELFLKKHKAAKKSTDLLEKMSDIEILNKAGILIKGQITNAALILLGKAESSYLFDGLFQESHGHYITEMVWQRHMSILICRSYWLLIKPTQKFVMKCIGIWQDSRHFL